ncbi:MAG: plasma-membrane proton-efflux P-type ATPase [Patescibacteria group bacterium]|nr:plasma-membrane proton-efflux P-type ATPase [Patescibacteria group bacterium]
MGEGLTTAEAQQRLRRFGFNEIKEKKPGVFLKFAKWLISPIALMLLAAALLSLAAKNVFDFWFILALMLLNFFVSFWQENKADRAVEKLQEKLAVQVKTLRDGRWQWLNSRELAPGDVISLGIGDIVPADASVVKAGNLTVNEAQLTGESLPKEKQTDDKLFSGSFLTTGEATAAVTATGKNTSFGKTLLLVQNVRRRSLLEQDILRISKFLSALSLLAVVVLTAILMAQHAPWLDVLLLDLSLIIAGIPISLPTVMSLIIGFGVLELAKKDTVVRQLSALEDLANVNLLLSDKTGTLTKNQISVERTIIYDQALTEAGLIKLAAATATQEKNPINRAVMGKFAALKLHNDLQIVKVIPGDSLRKRSTAVVKDHGQQLCVSIGATQIITGLCDLSAELAARFSSDVSQAAAQGFRSLALAVADGAQEQHMRLVGLLLLSDTVFSDARATIEFLNTNGIEVKMLTGDSRAISQRVAENLGLDGAEARILEKTALDKVDLKAQPAEWWQNKTVFAEILPEDKLKLTQTAKRYFRVAVTGDGVNDLPAIKTADVGIAVSGAVDALKSAADLVLLKPGIAVIRDAVFEARKIFSRLYSYSVYRISESLRLIVTIAVLGVIYKIYPLTPVQLILLAFLNDLPIISLAFNRVAVANQPAVINVKQRFVLSSLLGLTGVANSLLMFYLATSVFHLTLPVIETLFFLKLTIGGHMLIYVAHTEKRWYKFLPSRLVIVATTVTQLLATLLAVSGVFMTRAPAGWVAIIWLWAFFWMQISELVKYAQNHGRARGAA